MATTLIGAALNIILDPVFMFAFRMNIAGAAAATVLSQFASCLFVLLVLLRKKDLPVRLHPMRPSWRLTRQILAVGLSPFLILATDSIIIIAMNAALQYHGGPEYGDTLITCATVVQSYLLLITSPMLGITGGSQPLTAYNLGAGKQDRICKIVKCVLLLCIIFTSAMFFLSRVFAALFAGIFHLRPGIHQPVRLGNTRLHSDGRPAGLSVYICRFTDCPWNDQAFTGPVTIPENTLSPDRLPSALCLFAIRCILRGTAGRRHQRCNFHDSFSHRLFPFSFGSPEHCFNPDDIPLPVLTVRRSGRLPPTPGN